MPTMEPQRIGPYRIEGHLGSGGMGAVYKAWDDRLQRWVALKSLHPDREISPERRERLQREARAAGGLNHPAIAQVFDIVNDGSMDWIVMEYLEGRSLAVTLLDGPLAPDYAVDLARQIAEGLAAAHEAGIVHRDLKAENVMVTRGGRIKVLDFGLAKRVDTAREEDSLTQDGVVMGTSRAMSPEQAQGHEVDGRSDLFSLGSLLYEMVTGRHPFQGSGPLDTMQRVVRHRPLPANRVNRAVPGPLALLIEQLLEKEAPSRPQSALEVAVALAALGELWQTGTSDRSSLSRITAAARRRRLLRWRWLIGVAVIAATILAVVGAVRWAHRPPPTLYVAILQPELVSANSPPTADLVRRAVRTALLNGASALAGTVVVDPRAVDRVTGGAETVARAVAAEEVIAATVAPLEATFRITLRRLRGSDGALLWTDEFAVPSRGDPYLLIAEAVTNHLRSAYPKRPLRQGARPLSASADEMAEYLRLSAAIDNPTPALSGVEVLDRLTALRQRAPRFVEAATLEANQARFLYEAEKDRRFLERARAAVRHAQEVAPDDPRTIDALFDVELAAGDLESARAAVEHLAAVRPEDPDILEDRAKLAMRTGHPEEALASFHDLVEILPSWLNLWSLGNAELNAGHIADARRDLERGLEAAPGNSYLTGKLAQLELTAGDPARAVGLYRHLVESNPRSVPWLANLGTAELLAGRYQDATTHFRQVLELVPGYAPAMLGLGDALTLAGDSAAGTRLYSQLLRATDAASADPEIVGSRAQALAHLGRNQEAVAAAQEEIRRVPDDPFAAFSAALVYAVVGERNSCVGQARRALQLGLNPRWLDLPWFDSLRAAIGAAPPPPGSTSDVSSS